MERIKSMEIRTHEISATEREQGVEKLAGEYRAAYKDYSHMASLLVNEGEFNELFAQEKDRIAEHSVPVENSAVEIWKFANKEGKLERFRYPEAEAGDLIHGTNWERLAAAAAEPLKLLKAMPADFGDGIWGVEKPEGGAVTLSDIRYGRGKSQGKEDFPLAVRIPSSVLRYIESREKKTGSKRYIRGAGNLKTESYISGATGQGLPLLFAEFGMPDGKWHTLSDLLNLPEIRSKMETRVERRAKK